VRYFNQTAKLVQYTFYKCVKAYAVTRLAYECRTQKEIVLIKHSDIFYIIWKSRDCKTGVRLTNVYLLKLEVGTNQSHNVCP